MTFLDKITLIDLPLPCLIYHRFLVEVGYEFRDHDLLKSTNALVSSESRFLPFRFTDPFYNVQVIILRVLWTRYTVHQLGTAGGLNHLFR